MAKKPDKDINTNVDVVDFGFKQKEPVPLDAAYSSWASSKRTPEDNLAFLNSINKTIDQGISMYAGGSNAPYIRSKARMLALAAAGKYDASKSKLNTHILNSLQPLRRMVAETKSQIRVPEEVQYDIIKMREKIDELSDKYNREPTDEELSESLHLPMKRIARMRRAAKPEMSSGAFLEGMVQPAITHNDDDTWADYVYHDLGPTDKLIYEHRTGLNGKQVLGVSELAKKLGVSAATISKRSEAIAKMIGDRPRGI